MAYARAAHGGHGTKGWACVAFSLITLVMGVNAHASGRKPVVALKDSETAAPRAAVNTNTSGGPEARLIEIYRLIGRGESRIALAKAEALTRDVPNFQLAQLVYGDLLQARQGTLATMGAAPAELAASSPDQLAQLRREATLRLAALTERPPQQRLPRQFLDIPSATRHAIAVDASRSRLYLFENTDGAGLKLVADHYVSLGRLGVGKQIEGDQRTPLGLYFITSRLGGGQLKNFYGPGALTLNYPNEYDRRRGKTGSGIWLHGVPPENFARIPLTTDGCVVLANDDLARLLRDVAPRRTPVVIASKLEWFAPHEIEQERVAARALVERWRHARSAGDAHKLLALYSPQFTNGDAKLAQWAQTLEKERGAARGRASELKELSILSWRDQSEVLVVTFGEVLQGQRTGALRRQYWGKESGQWKIFFEGVIG